MSNPSHPITTTPNIDPPTQVEANTPSTSSLRQTTLDKFVTTTHTPPVAKPTTVRIPQKTLGTSNKERGFSFCNTTLCRYCKLIQKTGLITSHTTHEHYTYMKNVSCRSSNLIYCLTCQNCGKQYVGQTLRKIKDRLYEHLRDIDSLNKDKPLGVLFSHNCKENPAIKVHILEFIKKPPKSPEALTIRNRVEKRWIHLLKTPAPLGLNSDD